MKTMHSAIAKEIVFWSLIITLTMLAGRLQATQVLHCPSLSSSLQERMTWAETEWSHNIGHQEIWVGYFIEKWMPQNARIGWHDSRRHDILPTLQEILAGSDARFPAADDEETLLHAENRSLTNSLNNDIEQINGQKKLVILLRYHQNTNETPGLSCIRITDFDRLVNLSGFPLYWLGKAADMESLHFLDELAAGLSEVTLQNDLITAVAMHESKSSVIRILARILKTSENDDLRGTASFWLGQQDHIDALPHLNHAIRHDVSPEVRKKTVFSISQMSLREATDLLIDLAYNSKSRCVQKEAIFWLGQRASEKISETLTDLVFDIRETDIQKHAVFAISQLPARESLPELIRISKNHPNPEIRKSAIFWLGETREPEAVKTLAEIASSK